MPSQEENLLFSGYNGNNMDFTGNNWLDDQPRTGGDAIGDFVKGAGTLAAGYFGGPAGFYTAVSLINAKSQAEANDRMEKNSWDMYQQNRADQDTSVQRRVKDMIAAGINPLMAAGSGAGTANGSSPNLVAPQLDAGNLLNYLALKTNAQLKMRDQELADYSNKTARMSTMADVNYKNVMAWKEKNSPTGAMGKFWEGLLNEKNQNLSPNDLFKFFKMKMNGPRKNQDGDIRLERP